MKRTIVIFVMLVAAVAVLITGCNPWRNVGEIIYLDEEVYVYDEELPAGSVMDVSENRVAPRGRENRRRVDEFEYRILHVAQAPSVEVGASTVQANDIVIVDTEAYVVYNTAGNVFAGALQVIDFTRPEHPVITTEIALPHADVNAIAVTDSDIYIAGAWDPDFIANYADNAPDRAFIAKIALDELSRIDADAVDQRKVILDSFAATGIAIKGDTVFVSTGALDGELEILNSNLGLVDFVAYGDLRDIEAYRGGVIALQGTDNSGLLDGRVLTVSQDGTQKDELFIPDFTSAEKKATIEVYENQYAFLGLSEAGFQVVYLKDDSEAGDPVQSLFTIENPSGFDWTDKTDTNSASYNNDLIFTANGEAGIRVFNVAEPLQKDNPVPNFAQLLGFVPFDETDPDGDGIFWSANHIEYRTVETRRSGSGGFLVVASGVGGVNFYYLQTK